MKCKLKEIVIKVDEEIDIPLDHILLVDLVVDFSHDTSGRKTGIRILYLEEGD